MIKQINLFILSLFLITQVVQGREVAVQKKVALCITATGKYIDYAISLIESGKKNFLLNHSVTYFVFTDSPKESSLDTKFIYQKRLGWPHDTLMRFKIYLDHQSLFEGYDFVYAIDADMKFVSAIGDEILGDLVGTLHPGYYGKRGTYEYKRYSTAYVREHEGVNYFAGAFYGGKTNHFINLLTTNVGRINKDLKKRYIALWHDESHLNRYFIDFPPSKILNPGFCHPEGQSSNFEIKILALNKNHSDMRFCEK